MHSSFGANAKTYNGGFPAANFNGQRKSLEIGTDVQTAQFWEYNGDVGRRWNIDPINKPWASPYVTFGANPVIFIDPNGLDWYKDKKTNEARWFKGHRNRKGFEYLGNADWGDKHLFFKTEESALSEVVVIGLKKGDNSKKSETRSDKINSIKDQIGVVNQLINLSSNEASAAFKVTEKLDKALTVYDLAGGMNSLVSNKNPSNGNFFTGIPILGGLFQASGEQLDEQEKSLVELYLKNGYPSTIGMLINSTAGRRSGLTSIWVTDDVYKSVITRGYFDMSEYSSGREVMVPNKDNWRNPVNLDGVKFSYLLIFPQKSPIKIKQFLSQVIK